MAVSEQDFSQSSARVVPTGVLDLSREGWWLPMPVLVYLLMVMLPIHFHIGPLFLTGVRVVLMVMIVPLTINLLRGRYGRIYWTDVLFFLHVAWTAIALVVNNPDRVLLTVGATGVEFYGGYILARAYIRSVATFGALCRVLVLLVCLTLPLAVHEALTGNIILVETIRSLPGIDSVSVYDSVTHGQRFGLDRAQVFLAHPIHYGLFAAAVFPLAFVAFKGFYSSFVRYLAAGLVGLCVFFSLSSGAVLAMAIQLGLIFWAWMFDYTKHRWLILIGLMTVAYIVVDILSNRSPVMVFLAYASFSPSTAYGRALIFEWGMKNVWDNPIFGIGLNQWVRLWWMSGSMDNFWLVMAVRYGVPGFLLLAIGYLLPLWHVARRNFDSDPVLWRFRRAWMITFVGMTFVLISVHVWATVYSFVFFLFGAGMWFINAQPRGQAVASDIESDGRRPLVQLSRELPPPSRHGDLGTPSSDRAFSPASRSVPNRPIRKHDAPRYTRFPQSDTGNS